MPAFSLQPRLVETPALRIAGLSGEYTRETTHDISKQWDDFNAQLAASERYRAATATYGVVYPMAIMRYVSGVEIGPIDEVPEPWIDVILPAQRYALFAGTGGVEAIRAAWPAIFADWLPSSGYDLTSGAMIEKYPEDWLTSGNFEIWVPLAN